MDVRAALSVDSLVERSEQQQLSLYTAGKSQTPPLPFTGNELETYPPTYQQANKTRQAPDGSRSGATRDGSHSLILSTDSRVMMRWKDSMRRQRTRTTDVKSTIAVYITRNRSASPKNMVTARSGQRVATPDSGIGGDKSFEQMVIFLHGITESSGPSLRCT